MKDVIDLEELEALESRAFRAPWTYSKWDIECPTCESEGDCNNPECDGAHAPCTTIESPDEYPNRQIVAQFTVPGLSELADRNGAFIVALRNAFPELLAAARERDKLLARVAELEVQLDALRKREKISELLDEFIEGKIT